MKKGTYIVVIILLLINHSAGISNNYPTDITLYQINDESASSDTNLSQSNSVVKIAALNLLQGGPTNNWAPFLQDQNADLIFFTESGLWSPEDDSLQDAVDKVNALFPNETPYEGAATVPEWASSGNALFSRYPIKSFKDLHTMYYEDGSIYNINHSVLHVVVSIEGIDVHIIIVHLTSSSSGISSRLIEQELIINYIDGLGDVPIIYAGDFNSDSPQDTFVNVINSQNLGVEPIDMLINQSHPKSPENHQFIDMYKTLNPKSLNFTYIGKTYESRIDYIFVNQLLSDSIVDFTVHNNYDEINADWDHRPISAKLNFDHENTDLRPPVPVYNIETNVTENEVRLDWESNTDADLHGYNIYRDGTLLSTLAKDTTNYIDDTVVKNIDYQYVIRAIDNSSNESPISRAIYINPSYGEIILPKISNAVVDNTIPNTLKISWDVDDGGNEVVEYGIYRSPTETGLFIYFDSTVDPSFTDKISRTGLTVFYRIRARNIIGWGNILNLSGEVTGEEPTSTTEKNPSFSASIVIPILLTYNILRKSKMKK